MTWLSCLPVLGTAIGWLTGTMISPYESEKQQFESFAKVLAAFVTGFLVSKVNAIFDLLLKDEYRQLISNGMVLRRMMIGLTCALIAMMAVFVSRQYFHVDPPAGPKVIG